jgi:hypothetical protein
MSVVQTSDLGPYFAPYKEFVHMGVHDDGLMGHNIQRHVNSTAKIAVGQSCFKNSIVMGPFPAPLPAVSQGGVGDQRESVDGDDRYAPISRIGHDTQQIAAILNGWESGTVYKDRMHGQWLHEEDAMHRPTIRQAPHQERRNVVKTRYQATPLRLYSNTKVVGDARAACDRCLPIPNDEPVAKRYARHTSIFY